MTIKLSKEFIIEALVELCSTLVDSKITVRHESGYDKFYHKSTLLFKAWIYDQSGQLDASITRVHIQTTLLHRLINNFEINFGKCVTVTLNEL